MTIMMGIRQHEKRAEKFPLRQGWSQAGCFRRDLYPHGFKLRPERYLARRCNPWGVLACNDHITSSAPWYGFVTEQ